MLSTSLDKPQASVSSDSIQTLANEIQQIVGTARREASSAVNQELLHAYWNIGRVIVEFEQDGKTRGKYGKQTIKELSKRLTKELGKGFSRSNLQNMRSLYLSYEKCQTLSGKLTWSQ